MCVQSLDPLVIQIREEAIEIFSEEGKETAYALKAWAESRGLSVDVPEEASDVKEVVLIWNEDSISESSDDQPFTLDEEVHIYHLTDEEVIDILDEDENATMVNNASKRTDWGPSRRIPPDRNRTDERGIALLPTEADQGENSK